MFGAILKHNLLDCSRPIHVPALGIKEPGTLVEHVGPGVGFGVGLDLAVDRRELLEVWVSLVAEHPGRAASVSAGRPRQ
jgi:hypothetical protein